jgi:hypothetical protein
VRLTRSLPRLHVWEIPMTHLLLFFALLHPPITAPQTGASVNPSDYPITFHVYESHLVNECGSDNTGSSCFYMQVLRVTIDGKKFELTRRTDFNVFHLGDYHAKILKDKPARTEEYMREYEIKLSDGKPADFLVTGEFE